MPGSNEYQKSRSGLQEVVLAMMTSDTSASTTSRSHATPSHRQPFDICGFGKRPSSYLATSQHTMPNAHTSLNGEKIFSSMDSRRRNERR
jgi:hypothetical protein